MRGLLVRRARARARLGSHVPTERHPAGAHGLFRRLVVALAFGQLARRLPERLLPQASGHERLGVFRQSGPAEIGCGFVKIDIALLVSRGSLMASATR